MNNRNNNTMKKVKEPIKLDEIVIDPTNQEQMAELIKRANAPRPVSGIVITDEEQEAPVPPDTGNKSPIIEAELTEIQEGNDPPVPVQEKKEKIVTARGGNSYEDKLKFRRANLQSMIRRRDELNKSIARVKRELSEFEKAMKLLNDNL